MKNNVFRLRRRVKGMKIPINVVDECCLLSAVPTRKEEKVKIMRS